MFRNSLVNRTKFEYGAVFLRAFSLAIAFLALDFLGVGVFQSIGRGKISLVFAILRKLTFEIPATIIFNALFGINGIVYGAFAAEFMMACISTVALARMMKKLQNGKETI